MLDRAAPSPPQAPAAGARREQAAVALFGLFVFAAFALPVLDPAVQLYFRDTGRLYYPVKRLVADALARGELPLWDPRTECGTSLLAQVTPGLFHPATLLYLALPFDLAFKLNHLAALPLAFAGAYLLSRRVGAAAAAAAAGGVVYASCGFLLSSVASNLPFALGPATVPLAVAGFLAFLERPAPGRLAGAAAALALTAYAGDPQSMLFAGALAAGWALCLALGGQRDGLASPGASSPAARSRIAAAARALGLCALWSAAGLALAGPAAFPAAARLPATSRASGLSAQERARYSLSPLRLPGLLLPAAFDDDEVPASAGSPEDPALRPFAEIFGTGTKDSFAASIYLGAPALLLAAFAAAQRQGRALLAAAAVLAAAATGEALGVRGLLDALVPGLRLFRYSEKLLAPASLLLAVAAAVGAERCLARSAREAGRLTVGAGALCAVALAARGVLALAHDALAARLAAATVTHRLAAAEQFLALLGQGLLAAAALSAAVALVALFRLRTGSRLAAPLAAACCLAASLSGNARALPVAPLEIFRGPFPLAQELTRRASPEGAFRMYTLAEQLPRLPGVDARVVAMGALAQLLAPQFDSLAGLSGAAGYFSAGDPVYEESFRLAGRALVELFAVRFIVSYAPSMSAEEAASRGFAKTLFDAWLREYPPRPLAFLVHAARVVDLPAVPEALADPSFDPHATALLPPGSEALAQGLGPQETPAGASAAPVGPAAHGSLQLSRPCPERLDATVDGPRAAVAVFAEHFDPGWSATLDGKAAQVLRVDGSALGVAVPPGRHQVALRFRPVGLAAGLAALALCAAALCGWAAFLRRARSAARGA